MLDLNQSFAPSLSLTLKDWIYQSLTEALGNHLRVTFRFRLRGNNLHILCETFQETEAETVVKSWVKLLKANPTYLKRFDSEFEHPIYQVILYGRVYGNQDPDWIKSIILNQKNTPEKEKDAIEANSTALVSQKTLASSGDPEAIARYLSESVSHLGVSIRVAVQQLEPQVKASLFEDIITTKQRLWVFCDCNWDIGTSVLSEPIAEKLRELNLQGFRDAVIRCQITGETQLEWSLRVDLTHPDLMLKEWGHWGDLEAITTLLNRILNKDGLKVRSVMRKKTLHLFCHILPFNSSSQPDQNLAVSTIIKVLEELSPQGMEATTIYGTPPFQEGQPEQPFWVDWRKLPASHIPPLAIPTFELAKQGNQDALLFLLQRAINSDLEWRLATGGISIKICRKEDLLHLMTEAIVCPSQDQVIKPIEQLFRQLELPSVAGIRIYGRRAGQTSPLWNYGLDFVKRKAVIVSQHTSQTISKTPEFAPTPVEDLEEVLTPEFAPRSESFKETLEGVNDKIRELLCGVGLFIPLDLQNQNSLNSAKSQNLVAYEGVKVAAVWGILGVLLTLQIDWFLGRWVQVAVQAEPKPEQVVITEKEPVTKEVELPKLALQKSWEETDQTFNGSGFTSEGEAQVISEVVPQTSSQGVSAAMLAIARSNNPPFNNVLLDQKLALYQQRIKEKGVPDVMIIGSSRALRGVDPDALQKALLAQGYDKLDIFNFGINGATAKVVDFIIREVLTPEELPRLIIFADGARAFNSGREDLTYRAIANSEAYQKLLEGTFPRAVKSTTPKTPSSTLKPKNPTLRERVKDFDQNLSEILANLSFVHSQKSDLQSLLIKQFSPPIGNSKPSDDMVMAADTENLIQAQEMIDINGFLPLDVKFDPKVYYQNHPQVAGAYDSDYSGFSLAGEQHESLVNLMTFLKQHGVELVFVNQPLTDNYLDKNRLKYEQEFKAYMEKQVQEIGLIFRDLVHQEKWQTQYSFYSDPSHLNRFGAYQVSVQLSKDPMINWPNARR